MDSAPPPLTARDLPLTLAALLARIDRETTRLRGLPTPTESLGGLTALGQGVEKLLRALFEALCEARGWSSHTAFPQLTERGMRFDRAGAGQIVYACLRARETPGALAPLADALASELASDDSVLCQLVTLRNEVVHGRASRPPDAVMGLLQSAAQRLRPLSVG